MILNYKAIIKLTGIILIILAACMFPALFVSITYGETDAAFAFWLTILPMLVLGSILNLTTHIDSPRLKIRDGYAIVSICWVVCSVFGALPFIISGYIPNFADAFFETASGFTTTGSTILTNIEILPKGLLFWRSFTHWLGGMGILVFAIALLPALGMSGRRIASAETTGPMFGKLAPKLTDSAKILYMMYIGLTFLEVGLLMFGGMTVYDSFINTFGSMGTGGFSNYNASIAHYDSEYFEFIIGLFMFLAGINFTLFYCLLKKHFHTFWKDGELRCYFIILASSILLIALNLWFSNTYDSASEAFRYSAFQSISIMTTTGFATANFDLWPTFSKMILFLLMFVGGCSSSTSGGLKVIRVLILGKLMQRGIKIKLHPHAVFSIKFSGKAIPADTVSGVANFTILYIGIFFFGTLLLSLENFDLMTTASAVASCLGNVGPGFNLVGPILNYSIFSDIGTLFLGFLMLIGRLELFTIFILFTKQFWNPDK